MIKKTSVFDIEGKKLREIVLPSFFSKEIREDIVSKILEAKKSKQPYSPSLVAGKQHSASGKIVHTRHVWKSGYGRGMSRIPRKVMSRRGNQFNFVGAEVSATRGGRRAHPPKVISMININKINKKEIKIAMLSALSATADLKRIISKYKLINKEDLKQVPFIVESKIIELKTKEFIFSLKKILGKKPSEVAFRRKTLRSGKGKSRGRKYKRSAGLLVVIGNKESLKTKIFETKTSDNLSIIDLAKGGLGRLTIYTEKAIEDLQKKLNLEKENKK